MLDVDVHVIIKIIYIIIIKTFPESFAPKKISMAKNFVSFKYRRLLQHMARTATENYPSYQPKRGDVMSHVTMAKMLF